MNPERSINNLSIRIKRLDPFNGDSNDSIHWRGKGIIQLTEWIRLKGTPFALQYFPDDFDNIRTFLTESELIDKDEQTRKWYSDYFDLMEHRRNPNYGRIKCFDCLLSPNRDDPIFIGINRLVAKGLESKDGNTSPEYPCRIANRFECPYDYEKGKEFDARLNAEELFDLANMALAVEISLAVARQETSSIQIKSKEDLYGALTSREMFDMLLEQGLDYILTDKETFHDPSRFEQLHKCNRDKIVDYFMNIKDKIKLEELGLY